MENKLDLKVGKAIVVHGLLSEAGRKINGSSGRLESFNVQKQRWIVTLGSGRQLFVKRQNLANPIDEDSESDSDSSPISALKRPPPRKVKADRVIIACNKSMHSNTVVTPEEADRGTAEDPRVVAGLGSGAVGAHRLPQRRHSDPEVAPGNSLENRPCWKIERRDHDWQLEDVAKRNHERGLMLARSAARAKGNSKAISATFVYKPSPADNARARANVHHGNAHYNHSGSKQFQRGVRVQGVNQRKTGKAKANQAKRKGEKKTGGSKQKTSK